MSFSKSQNFSFKFVKLPFVSDKEKPHLPVAMVCNGSAGLENGVLSLKIKKELKQPASSVLALGANPTELDDFVKKAGKYISKDKIHKVRTNSLTDGNSKDPDKCMDNFNFIHSQLKEKIPKFVADANKKGAVRVEGISGSGGSYPAYVHALHQVEPFFAESYDTVLEPTEEDSQENLEPMLSILSEFDAKKHRLIYVRNPTQDEQQDFGTKAVISGITLGNEVHDASDEIRKLPRVSELNVGFQHVPVRWDLFGKVIDYDLTLRTTRNLLLQLSINPLKDIVLVAGRIPKELVQQSGDMLYDSWKNKIQVKIGEVKIENWNCVGGKFSEKKINYTTNSANERLKKRWNEGDEKY